MFIYLRLKVQFDIISILEVVGVTDAFFLLFSFSVFSSLFFSFFSLSLSLFLSFFFFFSFSFLSFLTRSFLCFSLTSHVLV